MLIEEFFEIEFDELKSDPFGIVFSKLDLSDNYFIDKNQRESRCCNCVVPK